MFDAQVLQVMERELEKLRIAFSALEEKVKVLEGDVVHLRGLAAQNEDLQ